MSHKPNRLPSPIEIRIDADTPAVDVIAVLLATIGRPPSGPNDQAWKQTISAFRREGLEERARLAQTLGQTAIETGKLRPEDLLIRDQIRTDRLASARARINGALFAATVASPSIVRSVMLELDEPLGFLDKAVRSPETRSSRIDRVLQLTDQLIQERERHSIPPDPNRIGNAGQSSQVEVRNIQHRVLKPARPVLHLAFGLKFLIETTEGKLARILPTREAWEREGLGTNPVIEADGTTTLRPRIMERHFFALPGLFQEALDIAELFRPSIEEYILAGRTTQLRPMICLIKS